MFFGANVPKAYDSDPAPPMKFGEALDRLRRYLDPASCAKCYFVEGFYLRPVLDAEKKKTAKKFRDVYVPLGDIRQRSDVRGLYNHPNDRGMLLIAERIWKYLEGGGLAREPGRYGAQAHVTGRWFEEREQACKTMAEAGLTRLRTDFVPKNSHVRIFFPEICNNGREHIRLVDGCPADTHKLVVSARAPAEIIFGFLLDTQNLLRLFDVVFPCRCQAQRPASQFTTVLRLTRSKSASACCERPACLRAARIRAPTDGKEVRLSREFIISPGLTRFIREAGTHKMTPTETSIGQNNTNDDKLQQAMQN